MSKQPPPKAASPALLVTILLLTVLEFLQSGMIAFAAGPIMGEVGASPEEYSLTVAVYACVAIATISKHRWLVERMGWRTFVLASLCMFVFGCLICVMGQSYQAFVIGRAVMGLGGAAFMTSGRVIVNIIPPGPHRFTGIKFFATGLAIGIAFAPGLAAFAVAQGQWRGIFGILIAIALVSALFAALSLPDDLVNRDLRSQSHPILFMALTSGSFLLLYTLQRSQYDYFSDATMLIAGAACGVLALYYFCRAAWRHERPVINLRALTHPRYLVGVGLFTLCYVLLGANNYVLPVLMQRTMGFSWHTVGWMQSIGLLSTLAAWLVMAWLMPRSPGPRKFFVVGFLALALFGWQLSRLTGEASLWSDVIPALMCNGIFLMFVMGTTAMQTFKDVQHQESVLSHAQQLKNMLAQFGTALGVAVSTLTLQWRAAEHYNALNVHFTSGDPIYLEALGRLTQTLASRGAGLQSESIALSQLAQMLSQQSMLLACLDYFAGIFAVGLIGAGAMLYQRLMR
ncbi:MAG TPA: MFS transporter [Polaromonas sp.]